MTVTLNTANFLWMIGVMQPISADELAAYLLTVFEDGSSLPDTEALHAFCMNQAKTGRLIRVDRNPDLFSLTARGNAMLTPLQHRTRDAERVFLLRKARVDRITGSRGDGPHKGLDGVSPSVEQRSDIEGTEANKLGLFVPRVQSYWPRFSKQLISQTGPKATSRDNALKLLSFANSEQLALACGRDRSLVEIDFSTLGAAIGLSPKLIQRMAVAPERYYRTFRLPKRSGGLRIIESPRSFLKITQHFLLDYFLCGLPVSECVHSYRSGRSIVTNAKPHVGKPFVANIDVENFFGSISKNSIEKSLMRHCLSERSVELIAQICTKDGVLPQGAPTSPAISNLVLFDFDEEMEKSARRRKLHYTRYADDITISGAEKDAILELVKIAEVRLRESLGLKLNREKTRIASRHGQQKVTGVVVNSKAVPPRTLRRNIRAAFHNASISTSTEAPKVGQLSGYLNYLAGFASLRRTSELRKYRRVLKSLRSPQ